MKTFRRSKIKVKTINDTNNLVYDDIFNILVTDPTEVNTTLKFNTVTNYWINKDTGAQNASNDYRATSFIDISGYTYLAYLNTPSPASTTTVTAGLCFYNGNKSAMPNTGVPLLIKGTLPQEIIIQIPEGAEYIRLCTATAYIDQTYLKLVKNIAVSNIANITERVEAIEAKIPQAPTNNGEYVLKATVLNGTPTYSWISTS